MSPPSKNPRHTRNKTRSSTVRRSFRPRLAVCEGRLRAASWRDGIGRKRHAPPVCHRRGNQRGHPCRRGAGRIAGAPAAAGNPWPRRPAQTTAMKSSRVRHWLNPRRVFFWTRALPLGILAAAVFLALWPGLQFDWEIYSNGQKRIAAYRRLWYMGEENLGIDFWSGRLTWDRRSELSTYHDCDFNPDFEMNGQSPRISLGIAVTIYRHEFRINWKGF